MRAPFAIDLALWVMCASVCLYALYALGYEGAWYRIHDAMDLTARPPFQHRVLFVFVARAVRALSPGFHDPRCFFVAQVIAASAATWAIRPWAERFLPRALAQLTRPLLVLLLVPTFTYWTFYDLGIVLFFTLCLHALVTRRHGLYLILFGIATLNHENTLTLIPVAWLLRDDLRRQPMRAAGWMLAQLAVYAAVRGALFALLPVDAAWQSGKLAYNAGLIASASPQLLKTLVALACWTAIVVAGWRHVPREIRVALLLVPELLVITVFFGQLNELRQFDAALPVVVVAIACAVSGTLAGAGRASGTAAAAGG